MIRVVIYYLLAINIVGFALYGIDKARAKRGRWRIPEMSLLMMALAGGSIGAWVGMHVWHHKTLHAKFKYGIPLILATQIVLIVVLAL